MITIVKHNLEERELMYSNSSKEQLLSMLAERYKIHTKEELLRIIAIDDIALSPNAVNNEEYNLEFKPVPYSQLNKPYSQLNKIK